MFNRRFNRRFKPPIQRLKKNDSSIKSGQRITDRLTQFRFQAKFNLDTVRGQFKDMILDKSEVQQNDRQRSSNKSRIEFSVESRNEVLIVRRLEIQKSREFFGKW